MKTSRSTSEVSDLRALPWLRSVVWMFDSRLRRNHDVVEYTDRTDCVFRIQLAPSPAELMLSDGTWLRVGDRTIVLHMWNEQFPEMPSTGPTVWWARRVIESLDSSLRELARHLRARPQLQDIKAIRVDASPVGLRQHTQYGHILAHYGFETVPSPEPRSPAEWARRLGENILISILVLARNPAAFRIDGLRRGRAVAYLSRRSLDNRYAAVDANRSRPR